MRKRQWWMRLMIVPFVSLVIGSMGIPATQAAPVEPFAHGVNCWADTFLADRGWYTSHTAETLHKVQCDRSVEVLKVQGAQENTWTGTYYYNEETCYDTDICQVILPESPRPYPPYPYEEGVWLMDTSGWAGIPGDPDYYGVIENHNLYVTCDIPSC